MQSPHCLCIGKRIWLRPLPPVKREFAEKVFQKQHPTTASLPNKPSPPLHLFSYFLHEQNCFQKISVFPTLLATFVLMGFSAITNFTSLAKRLTKTATLILVEVRALSAICELFKSSKTLVSKLPTALTGIATLTFGVQIGNCKWMTRARGLQKHVLTINWSLLR